MGMWMEGGGSWNGMLYQAAVTQVRRLEPGVAAGQTAEGHCLGHCSGHEQGRAGSSLVCWGGGDQGVGNQA
jgi:hypothetical protein